MIYLWYTCIYKLFNIFEGNGNKLNAIAFSSTGGSDIFSYIVNDYNNYAIENNLNSFIELNVVNDTSFTMEVTNYEETLLELFERKSNKYDFIFYDNIYSIRFGKYLEPLNNILSKEHVNMYLEGIASQTCIYRDKLVALVIFFLFFFIFIYINICILLLFFLSYI